MTADPQRRSALAAMKLAALVRDHAGEAPVVMGTLTGSAALVRGCEAWVLADERGPRALGAALAWARKQHADGRLHVLVEGFHAGDVARRAGLFARPVTVWEVRGRGLVPATATPRPVPREPNPGAWGLVDVMLAAGAEPSAEFGVLAGEVAGLEVCRAVHDTPTCQPRLEVGIGVHDREAFRLLHGDVSPGAALAEVVALVRRHRFFGAAPHPLNQLARERLLRALLIAEPERVDAIGLACAPPPVPRSNLKDPVPCVATGTDTTGRAVVVVCSTGADVDLVPFAADARDALDASAMLVLAVPSADCHPVTLALARELRAPARVVPIDIV